MNKNIYGSNTRVKVKGKDIDGKAAKGTVSQVNWFRGKEGETRGRLMEEIQKED